MNAFLLNIGDKPLLANLSYQLRRHLLKSSVLSYIDPKNDGFLFVLAQNHELGRLAAISEAQTAIAQTTKPKAIIDTFDGRNGSAPSKVDDNLIEAFAACSANNNGRPPARLLISVAPCPPVNKANTAVRARINHLDGRHPTLYQLFYPGLKYRTRERSYLMLRQ